MKHKTLDKQIVYTKKNNRRYVRCYNDGRSDGNNNETITFIIVPFRMYYFWLNTFALFVSFFYVRGRCGGILCFFFFRLCFIAPFLKSPKCLERFFLFFSFHFWLSQSKSMESFYRLSKFLFTAWTRWNVQAHSDGLKSK